MTATATPLREARTPATHPEAFDNGEVRLDSEEVRSVSSTGAEKGTKLARFDLIPTMPLTLLARHYGEGAKKYADRNWEAGYEWSKSYAALQRHITAFWGGEDIDEETGTPHPIAAAWHAIAITEYMMTHPEFDDRPTTVAARKARAEQLQKLADMFSTANDVAEPEEKAA